MILNNYKTHIVKNFKTVISNGNYYVFLSKVTPWANESVPDAVIDNETFLTKIKEEMIGGQKINSSDVAYVTKINKWSYGEIYPMYDNLNTTRNYFIINSNNDVFKCIDNNYNSPSTEEPLSTITNIFETADGYKWKYMFSIDSATLNKFSTGDYYPIIEDQTIINAAVPGTIETILVEDGGYGYETTSGIVQEIVSSTKFRIESDKTTINEYYKNYYVYFENGPSAYQVRTIVSYISDSTGNYVVLDSPVTLDLTTRYRILPKIEITGNGSGAICIPEVDALNGSIKRIEMLNVGSNYTYAEAQIIQTSKGNGASLRAIISPLGGHGSDPVNEMGCEEIMVSVTLDTTTLPTGIDYRQIGILTDINDISGNPITTNPFTTYDVMTITMSGTTPFPVGETIKGLDTNTTGIVMSSSLTEVKVLTKYGSFNVGETLYGLDSSLTAILDGITYTDINKYDCNILSVENLQPIRRSSTAPETYKQIIKV